VFDQLDQASRTVAAITARGLTPAAIEMIDQLTIQAVEDAFGAGYPRDAAAALLIELDGLETGLDDEAAHVVAACREAGARDVRLAQTRPSASSCGRAGSSPSAPTGASPPPTW
jgi:glycolate oxidase